MRYIIRKFVDAQTVAEAISKEPQTPIHDAYLKEGEEPNESGGYCSAVGFGVPTDDQWRSGEIIGRKKR